MILKEIKMGEIVKYLECLIHVQHFLAAQRIKSVFELDLLVDSQSIFDHRKMVGASLPISSSTVCKRTG